MERNSNANTDTTLLKTVGLVVLVFQTTALVLLMRYTRLHPIVGAPLYLTSTAVFLAEVCKVLSCVAAIFIQSGKLLAQLAASILKV